MNEDVEVINHSSLTLIGKGRQGAVFQLSDTICVKVFGNIEDCEREYYALSLRQQIDLFPRLYAKGPRMVSLEEKKAIVSSLVRRRKRDLPNLIQKFIVKVYEPLHGNQQ